MTIFVTGSSSKVSSREIPTELRGRCLEIKLFPLSFREFLDFKSIKIDLKKANVKKVESAFPDYEVIGMSAKEGTGFDDFYEGVFRLSKRV